jgi:hypothetical protein
MRILYVICFSPPTDPLGELVPMLQQILLQTKVLKPPRETVKASEISAKDVQKYFRCGQRRHQSFSCLSYDNEAKTAVILDAVVALSREMQLIPHEKWVNCEIPLVQPYVHNTFLPVIVGCLDNAELVELERERKFELKAMNDEDGVLPVNGATDHCAKIVRSDCRVFTVEDKTVCKTISLKYIAQTRSEMMVEVRDMFDFFNYVPQRYCGIIHNCSQWLFIEREVIGNDAHWSYVRLPPIFTSPDSEIDMLNCGLVATFLEHVLKVADSIIVDVCNNRFVSTKLPLLSISDHGSDNDDHDDDDNNDDHDDDDNNDDNDDNIDIAVGAKTGGGKRSIRKGAGLSSEHKYNVRVSNGYNMISTAGKENGYMPLTAVNLSMRPSNFIKKF